MVHRRARRYSEAGARVGTGRGGVIVDAAETTRARRQTLGEEIANSVSHGAGLIGAIVGTPFLIVGAVRHGDAGVIVGAAVFCATMIALYCASTVYHALPAGRLKRLFGVIDHSAIFLLIAGTYTPFTLGVLRGTTGWTLFAIVWVVASAGVLLKAVGRARHPLVSTGLYLALGWLIVFALDALVAAVPVQGLLWLAAGGLSYTVGLVFFATDSMIRYGHMVWHGFVVGGTTCHYFAVLWYAA